MFEREEHLINSPSHNGTPLLLHDPFQIQVSSLILVLVSCKKFEKKNIQLKPAEKKPETMLKPV